MKEHTSTEHVSFSPYESNLNGDALNLHESFLRFVPPPRFVDATFKTYIPKTASQANAVKKMSLLASIISKPSFFQGCVKVLKRNRKKGLYLDGAYGTGKTHLIASLYHQATVQKKIYLSFTELTYLAGLVGARKTRQALSEYKLICIDEFELDDPGNTTIIANLLRHFFLSGTYIATTSNTPQADLGKGRFSASAFKRELKEMSYYFDILKIEGEDFRKKNIHGMYKHSAWVISNKNHKSISKMPSNIIAKNTLSQKNLLSLLSNNHPFQYISLIKSFESLLVNDMLPISNQFDGLRFVYFIDKAYDEKLTLHFFSPFSIEELFPESFYQSAYANKYYRCVSRLKEICSKNVY